MNLLLSLDLGIFRFINETLSNSFFDRVMPFLSGNAFFAPAVVLVAAWMFWKGGLRGRLCFLFILLAVALGDTVICNTLKEAVGRERPFHVLSEVNVPPGIGKTGSGSLPSSHAANWFSATMIALIFYRRSWRFMLPMAVLVAFSRVYNGVHYPSDVLVGAILGAGYGFAFVWLGNALWQVIGQKWFPAWWQRLPSLANPVTRDAANSPAPFPVTLEAQMLQLGYLLIGTLLLARLAYLASGKIELSGDEAYQWLWSRHLALSYFSKPLMIAVLQWLGTNIAGDVELGVRFFSPVISAALSLLVLRFLAREANARVGVIAVLMLTAAPMLTVGSILMTVDPPLILFWTLAMFSGWKALKTVEASATPWWMLSGLFLGLSFLSKYTALCQLFCWGLFFALWKPARVHLRRPGPYLALLLFLLCTLPVLIWNAQNDWITVAHVSDNAGRSAPWTPTLKYLIDFIGSQGALLNPIFFLAMLWAVFGFWKTERRNPLYLFLFCMGAPVFFGYMAFTAYKRVLPNWPTPAILPLFLLMILYWHQRWLRGAKAVKTWLIAGLVLGLTVVLFAHDTNLVRKIAGRTLPAEIDPLRRVRAWKETARVVEAARAELSASGPPAFIIGANYALAGQLSFYIPEANAAANARQPLVYYVSSDQPKNQFFFWPEYRYPDHRKGQNAIFVQELKLSEKVGRPFPEELKKEFATVSELGVFDIHYRDRVFRRVQLLACRNLQ